MSRQKTQTEKIDFVIPWVDGRDPEWQRRKAACTGEALSDGREERYRDWDVMRYWFRAVETYTPWVNRIFFICDQKPPEWLNTGHAQLRVIRHEDYIPTSYLPTFSSHPIEHNLHRIPGLSEKFVYFNDDMFLLQPLESSFFFSERAPAGPGSTQPVADRRTEERGKGRNHFLYPAQQHRIPEPGFRFQELHPKASPEMAELPIRQ